MAAASTFAARAFFTLVTIAAQASAITGMLARY